VVTNSDESGRAPYSVADAKAAAIECLSATKAVFDATRPLVEGKLVPDFVPTLKNLLQLDYEISELVRHPFEDYRPHFIRLYNAVIDGVYPIAWYWPALSRYYLTGESTPEIDDAPVVAWMLALNTLDYWSASLPDRDGFAQARWNWARGYTPGEYDDMKSRSRMWGHIAPYFLTAYFEADPWGPLFSAVEAAVSPVPDNYIPWSDDQPSLPAGERLLQWLLGQLGILSREIQGDISRRKRLLYEIERFAEAADGAQWEKAYDHLAEVERPLPIPSDEVLRYFHPLGPFDLLMYLQSACITLRRSMNATFPIPNPEVREQFDKRHETDEVQFLQPGILTKEITSEDIPHAAQEVRNELVNIGNYYQGAHNEVLARLECAERGDGAGFLAAQELAGKYGVPLDALRKRLERWRKDNPDLAGKKFTEMVDRRGDSEKWLYVEAAVVDIILDLRKNRKTPDKRPHKR